ncbi:sarcosine oxidase subunit alpha family protein [Sphingomonas populi]|uniref:Sarcosine oxidase subunit alpha family protein n=1 Tax=Sphingomonas populi TaxID=2484750 RepID=A0A4Q6Y3H9_9SPHN|nr:sarcosine oxidase subunit alpha family protein [Sphingomonas populi]
MARLAQGGRIDRTRPLRFIWEGRGYQGYAGDTLASALMANGVTLVGRSFKYHRPRGIIGAGVEESNALVQLGDGARSTPNMRATEVLLYDGLVARPVNCFPNSRFDIGSINNLVARFLPAGFYYKTFMWPDWHLYEGFIRRAAGLGKVARQADPDRYESRFAHCDVLVVGSGPAGLAAANAAAASGARVILADQDDGIGGALRYEDISVDGQAGADWAARIGGAIAAQPEAKILLRTAVVGYHDHNSLTMVQQLANEAECAADPTRARYRTWQVRAGRVVLATGAIERPLVFPGNDRPGVMLATAARHYARRFAVLPGRRAVVFTNNDDAYRTALALAACGVVVAAMVDVRDTVSADLAAVLDARGIRLITGATVIDTRGRKRINRALVRSARGEEWIACDHLAMSGGFNPTVHLFSQSGGVTRYDEAIAAFVPGVSVQDERSVGAAAGAYATKDALEAGEGAGREAAALVGYDVLPSTAPWTTDERPEASLLPCWQVEGRRSKAFVDFQNDVSVGDITLSARENFRSVEHLKRYTTLGMAADQGKTSNVNALAIMGALTGRSVEETGHTRYRFPFTPIPLGSMGGRNRGELFRPRRRMPAHDRHVAANAVFEDYGGWMRPAYYLNFGETPHQAEQREALAVRTAAGLFEGSPLGKIEVKGPDAGRFLDLIYANTMSTLRPGKVRYGLMLSEQGVVIDDGVATRLGDDHFLIGTSSGGAETIVAWMEEWLQCEWLDLDVLVAPVTAAWGVLTITGPKARTILDAVGTTVPLDDFPHMSFAEGTVAGVPARVFRVSYTGETSYEINVPARSSAFLWDVLMAAGQSQGLIPVGIDAWMVLRTEKGFLHIGADTDGTTTALDVGWGHVLKKKNEFVGKRSLLRSADQRADRLQFVGFAVAAGESPLPIGGHVVATASDGTALSEGYVTSTAFSPFLKSAVALGMVRGGLARKGETVRIGAGRAARTATIVDPTFYDPDGERLR